MAYTAPTTRATDDLITATIWNTDLVDNITELHDRLTSATVLLDVKASGTDGGASTAGTWHTRDLQTKQGDESGNVTLAANQFTLTAGKWLVTAFTSIDGSRDWGKARIYNDTDSSVALIGLVSSTSFEDKNVITGVAGYLDLSTSKTFELQLYHSETLATGLGQNLSGGIDNVYSFVILEKVG